MPIDTKHPVFTFYANQWERCRDAFEGQDMIKAKGTKYLPRLTKQTDDEYAAYKDRALFFSIVAKTIQALVGMAMVRTPIVKMPDRMSAYFVDNNGIQFFEILAQSLSENLLLGRLGLLIDRPTDGGDPYIVIYTAESIINWEVDDLGKPVFVVLHEKVLKPGKDRYERLVEDQWRVLEMVDGRYTVTLFDKGKQPGPTVIPTNGGQPLDYIPLVVVNPLGVGTGLQKSPMLDIVDINISHYRSSADLEHGRHFTALPTPVVIGGTPDGDLKVGSTSAWVLADPNADAKFLEFTGQGLQSLERALQEKQSQMASLSARLLDNSKRGSEAADTVRLRYSSETASLAMVVRSTEAGLNEAYRIVARFLGLDENAVMIQLNKEFLETRMESSHVVDLVSSFIEGGISAETLIHNLRRGDIVPVDRSDEEEIAAVTKARNEVVAREEAAARAAKRPAVKAA